MKLHLLILALLAWLGTTSPAVSAALDMPTLALRQEALAAFSAGKPVEAQQALHSAQVIAHRQPNPYVKANELRYIADAWARIAMSGQAQKAFAESMDAAIAIPTWNHRLYASIGVIEMQRVTGDLDGTRDNGIKALDSGLMEVVIASGGAAEMGRFFAAMDGLLTQKEHGELEQRIHLMPDAAFRRKALRALERMTTR